MMLTMASPTHKPESKLLPEAQLRAILNIVPAYAWYAAPSGALRFVNERSADYGGLPKDHPLRFGTGAGEEWDLHIAFLHPDDRDEARRAWAECLRTGRASEVSFRVRGAEGGYRWFLSRAEPVRDATGAVLYWVGVNLDIEERKQAEFKLRRSKAHLADAQRLSRTGSVGMERTTKRIFWSEEAARIYGYPSGTDPTPELILQRSHPDDVGLLKDVLERAAQGGNDFDWEHRLVMPDGSIKYLHDLAHCIRDEAGNEEIVGAILDITERKVAEETIRRSEAYLAEAQRLSHTGSFGWKPDSGEIVWSAETYRIFEVDLGTKPVLDQVVQRVYPDDRGLVQQIIERASQTGSDFENELRLQMPDGRVKHVHAIAHALKDVSGNCEFVGAVTDITERQLAEEKIREQERNLRISEAYLAEAQRLSHTGSFAWSPTRDNIYFSEECYRILGFEPNGNPPPFETIVQRIHPDDQAHCRELVEKALRDKAHLEIDYRIIHPNKTVKNIHCLAHAVLDQNGDFAEFVGTVIDVTEHIRAEAEQRRSEIELRQVLDLSPQLIAVFGPRFERLFTNQTGLDYFGLTLDEWRETAPGAVGHPDDVKRFHVQWERAVSGGFALEIEFRLRKSDGSYHWFLARYNPVRDEQGQVSRWYVAATDIDDRKRAEERLQQENVALREEIDRASMFEEIVGTSPALQAVLSRVSKVATTDSTVLITGETGTGKELVARAIHRRSHRASRAFVSVNCAAIPRDLIASELFGHEKGAFTGAIQRRIGRFELAEGGTIFLDEVGELSAEAQVAVLRVLQEREFERVGGRQLIHVDVRVIAATNRDLKAAVASGSFRQDLYYRLNVFPLEVPPLRERRKDIPLLVKYFIDRYARKAGKNIKSVDKTTVQLLQSYPWPGNIRELQNVIERSVIVCETETFSVDESWLSQQPRDERSGGKLRFSQKLAATEKEIIEEALGESQGRVYGPSGAATKLGIARSTLEMKIRSLNIDKNRFKARPGT
jgi:formate hydrogenlyase transcriptional activator